MAASFNRSSWYLKGEVIGREMRAFSNFNWHRGDPRGFIGLTGYGPNVRHGYASRVSKNANTSVLD